MKTLIVAAALLIAGCSGGSGRPDVSLTPSLEAAGDAGAAGEQGVTYDGPLIHEPRDGIDEPSAPRLPASQR